MTEENITPVWYTIHCYVAEKNNKGVVCITVDDTLLFSLSKEELLLKCYTLACDSLKNNVEEMIGYSVVSRSREYNGFPGVELVKENEEGYKVAWIVVPEEPKGK